MGARGLFIAGTDTGVGKTRVAADLMRALGRSGLRVAGMKPVAAGADPTPEGLRNDDALALAAAATVQLPYGSINPYCFPLAASPHIAAKHAGIELTLAPIRREFAKLSAHADIVVVEGAGGWLAPISDSQTMADIARVLNLPVLLVVGMRLGCLNHAMLTAQAIAHDGLRLAGWVANHLPLDFDHAAENVATLERRLPAPLLDSIACNASGFASADAARALLVSLDRA